MFSWLTSICTKFRVIIVAIWVIAAVGLFIFAPAISEVGVTDESQFLPRDTQSAEAQRLLDDKFPATSEAPASSGLIVFHSETGLTEADFAEAENVRDWLVSGTAPAEVSGVTSVFDGEALRSTLVSEDQTTMLMMVDFSVPPLSDAAREAVAQIRDYLQQEHPGVSTYLTGEIGFFQDLFTSIQQTIHRTTLVTLILVTVLLLAIYRSPVAALLPLLAIGCSFAVARGILGYMGAAGMEISTMVDAYLVVIVFGVGTDYCLFIVSRFREELRHKERLEAQSSTMKRIGPVIAASALTVVVAFLALALSRFGMTKSTGYAMAIGVAITLVAGQTLVPALMSIFGKHLFWPAGISNTPRKQGFGWANIGSWVSRHPLVVTIPIILLLLVPYVTLPNLSRSSDLINQMPSSSQSVQGYEVMSEHFAEGEFAPLYLLVESPETDMTDASSLPAIESLALSLSDVPGVGRVDYYAAPSGQVSGLAAQLRNLGGQLGSGTALTELSPALQSAGQFLEGLALQYPGIVQSPSFQQAGANLAEVSALSAQVATATPEKLMTLVGQIQSLTIGLADSLDSLAGEFNLQANTPFTAYLLGTYFAADGTAARLNVILADPHALDTKDTIAHIRETAETAIATSSLEGGKSYLGGDSATQADILITNDADFGRVSGLATAGIFLVIIILLRSILAPLYMVLTVLLNYGATLGIATWLFLDVMKQSSMIYMLPIFIFVILVALGADYNIFLVSRIREEAQHWPIKEAVSRAVANTGGVITACGIILAGTFATLTTAPLQVVLQIGGAIAIGVLVDTFVVRALLVPALATLAGRWSWWPSRLFWNLAEPDEDTR